MGKIIDIKSIIDAGGYTEENQDSGNVDLDNLQIYTTESGKKTLYPNYDAVPKPNAGVTLNTETGEITVDIPDKWKDDEQVKKYIDNYMLTNISGNYINNKDVQYQDPFDETKQIKTEEWIKKLNDALQFRVQALNATAPTKAELISRYGGSDNKNKAINGMTTDDIIIMSANFKDDDSWVPLPAYMLLAYPELEKLESYTNGWVKKNDYLENFYNIESGKITERNAYGIASTPEKMLSEVEDMSPEEIAKTIAFGNFIHQVDPKRSNWEQFLQAGDALHSGFTAGTYDWFVETSDLITGVVSLSWITGEPVDTRGFWNGLIGNLAGRGEAYDVGAAELRKMEDMALTNKDALSKAQAGYAQGRLAGQLVDTLVSMVVVGETTKALSNFITTKITSGGAVSVADKMANASTAVSSSTALTTPEVAEASSLADMAKNAATLKNAAAGSGAYQAFFKQTLGGALDLYSKSVSGATVALGVMDAAKFANVVNSAARIATAANFANTAVSVLGNMVFAAVVGNKELTTRVLTSNATSDEAKTWVQQMMWDTATITGLSYAQNLAVDTFGRPLANSKAAEWVRNVKQKASQKFTGFTERISTPWLNFMQWYNSNRAAAAKATTGAATNARAAQGEAIREAVFANEARAYGAHLSTEPGSYGTKIVEEALRSSGVRPGVTMSETLENLARAGIVFDPANLNLSEYEAWQSNMAGLRVAESNWGAIDENISQVVHEFSDPDIQPMISEQLSEVNKANSAMLQLEEAQGLLSRPEIKQNKGLLKEDGGYIYANHSKELSRYIVRGYELRVIANEGRALGHQNLEEYKPYVEARTRLEQASKGLAPRLREIADKEYVPALANAERNIIDVMVNDGVYPRAFVEAMRASGKFGIDGKDWLRLVARQDTPKGAYTPFSGTVKEDNTISINKFRVLDDEDITWPGNGLQKLIEEYGVSRAEKALVKEGKQATGKTTEVVVSGEKTRSAGLMKEFRGNFLSAVKQGIKSFVQTASGTVAIGKTRSAEQSAFLKEVADIGGVETIDIDSLRVIMKEKGLPMAEDILDQESLDKFLSESSEEARKLVIDAVGEKMSGLPKFDGFNIEDVSGETLRMINSTNAPGEYSRDTNSLKEYYAIHKGQEGKILIMSPDQYLKNLTGKGKPYKKIEDIVNRSSQDKISDYAKKMKEGEKFPVPYINFDNKGRLSQEGIHRALAAKEAGISEMPVSVSYAIGNEPKLLYEKDITNDIDDLLGEGPNFKNELYNKQFNKLTELKQSNNRQYEDLLDKLDRANAKVSDDVKQSGEVQVAAEEYRKNIKDFENAVLFNQKFSYMIKAQTSKNTMTAFAEENGITLPEGKGSAKSKMKSALWQMLVDGKELPAIKGLKKTDVKNIKNNLEIFKDTEESEAINKQFKKNFYKMLDETDLFKNAGGPNPLKYELDEEAIYNDIDEAIGDMITRIKLSSDANAAIEGIILNQGYQMSDVRYEFTVLDQILSKEMKKELSGTIEELSRKIVDNLIPKNSLVIKGNIGSLYKKVETAINDKLKARFATAKTTLESMGEEVESATITQLLEEYNSEIKGASEDPTVIKTMDENGEIQYERVSPTLASIYNERPTYSPMSTPMKILNNLAILKKINQTDFSPRSFSKQAVSDPAMAFATVGALPGTLHAIRDEIASQFSPTLLRDMEKSDPLRLNNIKAIADREGISIEEAFKRNSEAIAKTQVPFTLLNNELLRQAKISKFGNDGMAEMNRRKMSEKINDGLRKVSDKLGFFQNKRETYVRLYAGEKAFMDALRKGYNLEQAENFREYALNTATTNFRTKHSVFNMLRSTVPYLTSGISGAKSFWQMFELDPIGMTSRIFSGFVVPILYFAGEIFSDENLKKKYEALAESEKENHIVIAIGGELVLVPVGEEIGKYTNIVMHAVENMYNENQYGFWSLMLNDLVSLIPGADFTGFTDPEMWGDLSGEAPTFLEVAENGIAKMLSGTMPPVVQSAILAATGRDLYTGRKMNNSYITIDEEGNPVLMSNSQSQFAKTIASVVGGDARVIERVISGTVGTVALHTLDVLTSAAQFVGSQGEEGSLTTVFDKTFEDLSAPFAPHGYNELDRRLNYAISALYDKKESIQNDKVYIKYNQDIASEKDPKKRQNLINKRNELFADYIKKVEALIKGYKAAGGTLDKWKFSKAVSLITFEDAVRADRQFMDINTNYSDAYKQAMQSLYDMGITNPEGPSSLGYIYTDDEGKPQLKMWTPTQMQIIQNQFYEQGNIHAARINAIIDDGTANSLKKQRQLEGNAEQPYWDKYNATGKLSDAEWDAIDDLRKSYNAAVVLGLKDYMNTYGATNVLSNDKVIDYLTDVIKVPSGYETIKGRYISSGSGKLDKQSGFAESYIKTIFGVK